MPTYQIINRDHNILVDMFLGQLPSYTTHDFDGAVFEGSTIRLPSGDYTYCYTHATLNHGYAYWSCVYLNRPIPLSEVIAARSQSPVYLNAGFQVDLGRPDVCSHEWTPYQGLTESYSFCTKCDVKQKG